MSEQIDTKAIVAGVNKLTESRNTVRASDFMKFLPLYSSKALMSMTKEELRKLSIEFQQEFSMFHNIRVTKDTPVEGTDNYEILVEFGKPFRSPKPINDFTAQSDQVIDAFTAAHIHEHPLRTDVERMTGLLLKCVLEAQDDAELIAESKELLGIGESIGNVVAGGDFNEESSDTSLEDTMVWDD